MKTQSYQQIRDYVEGNRVWYQPLNGTSWLGPASVLCQRGQSVWVHTNGDIKKVAACKTKSYELLVTESLEPPEYQESQDKKKRKVMLEDGLSDVEDLLDPEEEKRKDALKVTDAKSDIVGTNYLKVVNHMSFLIMPSTQ